MTLDAWLALPEADPVTRGCPHCGAVHFQAVRKPGGGLPAVYRCRGTDDFAVTEPGCGTLFRGRDGVHYLRENWPLLDRAEGVSGEARRVYHRTSRRHDVALVVALLVLVAVALGTR